MSLDVALSTMSVRHSRRALACIIFVVALFVRLPAVVASPVVLTEGTTYITLARNLLAGRGYIGILGDIEPFVPPLYPLLTALLTPLAGDAILSARLISLLTGAALAPALYLVSPWFFPQRSGLPAALLALAAPILVEYSSFESSETLYTLLTMLGLAWGWRAAHTPTAGPALVTGLLLGAAYLTRIEGAFALLPVIVAFLLRPWLAPALALSRRAAASRLIALLGAFALLALPYILWLSLTLDRVAFESKSALNFIIATRMAAGSAYVDAAYGLDDAGQPWGVFLQRTAQLNQPLPADLPPIWSAERLPLLWQGLRSVRQELALHFLPPLALLAIIAGIASSFGAWPGARPRPPTLAAVAYVTLFCGLALLTVALAPLVYTRYLLPILPFCWLAAGAGLALVAAPPARPYRLALMLALTVAILVTLPRGSSISSRRAVEEDQRRAGQWLAQRTPPGPLRILAVHSQIPFYTADPGSAHAGSVHLPMPNGTPARTVAYAAALRADIIVVSPRKLAGRPALTAWQTGAALPPPWQLIYRDPQAVGGDLLIWQRTPAP